jgi:hypothetical protein
MARLLAVAAEPNKWLTYGYITTTLRCFLAILATKPLVSY